MPLMRLDHVNMRTANLEGLCGFYEGLLGMERGFRPDFDFPGAWLYAGGHPVIHLVAVDTPAAARGDGRIDHVAFLASEWDEIVARLRAAQVPFKLATVPTTGATQIFLHDPDGNRIELQFPPATR
jgi:catechol 2,3-dioxygenase-like lactoylglutathione lyase family enzyme